MTFEEASLETIDFENETFRISENLDPPGLRASLNAVGQLCPVVLFPHGKALRIICGFRRLRALRDLGKNTALARIVDGESFDMMQAFSLAFWDNLAHRQLHPLEKARALANLRNHFGVPDALIVRDYLPILDLSPAAGVLQSFLLLHGINPALRRCFTESRLTYGSLDALAAKSEALQERVAFLMGKIRLSASLQKKLLELLGFSVTVEENRPLTFSVSASVQNGSLSGLRYQWQRNGMDIVGAAGASYTLDRGRLADDGARFRVRVWAVGHGWDYGNDGVILHWDGAAWGVAPGPSPVVPNSWSIRESPLTLNISPLRVSIPSVSSRVKEA